MTTSWASVTRVDNGRSLASWPVTSIFLIGHNQTFDIYAEIVSCTNVVLYVKIIAMENRNASIQSHHHHGHRPMRRGPLRP